MPDDNSGLEPPDPISNSEVKRTNANGSAGSPCVRVGNRQAFIFKPALCGLFFVYNSGYVNFGNFMIIGLTGGIGSGKSAAGTEFENLGITVIDADAIAQEVTLKNSKAYTKIVNHFGNNILDDNQNINRRRLRKIVFNNEIQKNKLEEILHPAIRDNINIAISKSISPYTIIMVPLIYETNSKDNYNRVLVIDCDEDIQISRASMRDEVAKKDIKKIIASQASREERLGIADDVICNNSSIQALKEQVLNLHHNYLELVNG